MAGRPPKPTALRMLQGNPGKRPPPKNEPQPIVPRRIPPPPRHLSDEAKREWRRMGRELVRLGLFTGIDTAQFAIYCQAWGHWIEAEEKLRLFGPVLISPSKIPVVSPYLSVSRAAVDQMQRALVQFGMSPSSRAKVAAAKPDLDDDDPAVAWMREAL